jgi:hypothetical protein
VPEPPATPPAFDVFETAARLRDSVEIWWRHDEQYWHWQRAPFGPAVSAEEATALFTTCGNLIRTADEAATQMTHYRGGRLTDEDAVQRAHSPYLPAAARLAGIVAIAGPMKLTNSLLEVDPSAWYLVKTLHGYRAGVLPHLTSDERTALMERVRDRCEAAPWHQGPDPPHVEHLLAGQLALHEICAHTLATNPDIVRAHGAPLLVHGLASADEVIAAHRRVLNRWREDPWYGYAWLAVTGIEGVPELFDGIQPQHARAERRLAPLLRRSWPTLEPYMRQLLGTSVDKRVRAWLKTHAT